MRIQFTIPLLIAFGLGCMTCLLLTGPETNATAAISQAGSLAEKVAALENQNRAMDQRLATLETDLVDLTGRVDYIQAAENAPGSHKVALPRNQMYVVTIDTIPGGVDQAMLRDAMNKLAVTQEEIYDLQKLIDEYTESPNDEKREERLHSLERLRETRSTLKLREGSVVRLQGDIKRLERPRKPRQRLVGHNGADVKIILTTMGDLSGPISKIQPGMVISWKGKSQSMTETQHEYDIQRVELVKTP
mgnify:CR=1 FL=1